ncbi:DUF262 domain-containing protein [Desulfococcaceae bacterium HSG7]|nr:DUF262 domain-containing protein [Desulfococcaceae bacterium HSG7]
MDTLAQTESIVDLIRGVEKESIVLPEFQRNFVWEMGKTYDLFDSLVKNIFIGSIIYGVPSFEITIREIDLRPRKGKGSRKKLDHQSYTKAQISQKVKTGGFRLLLDGQQRITSLFRALRGEDKLWFISRQLDKIDSNGSIGKLNLEEILLEFSGQESTERLSIKISDVFEMMNNDYMEAEIKEKFFDKLKYHQDFDDKGKQKVFRNYLVLKNKLQDLLKSEKLLSYYLLDTTLEKFALFFERSNSRGIQLNFIDILAAKLYEGFNLRSNISEFEDKYTNYKLIKEIIVRAIAFIVLNKKDIARSSILKHLTPKHFNEHWKPVCQWYKQTLDFLYENHMIIAQSWMPYENMLIPLMMFLKEIGGNFSQMTERQNKFLKFWYWASIFAQRYTGSSNETIIQDSLILIQIAKDKKITDRNYFYKLRSQVTSAEELHSFTKKPSAVYKGIFNIINYNAKGLIDWSNTSKLSFNQSKIDAHHIFPRKYISTKYRDNEKALSYKDSVVNKALIPKLTNIKIGYKAPAEYLNELRKKNPKLKKSLKNHFIPVELIEGMYDDDYLFFLEERAEAIFKLIDMTLISKSEEIKIEFYQEPKILQTKKKVKIFAKYYNNKVYADFYLESNEVFYQGKMYSPSGAAIAAKKNISGKDSTANGWAFWKYTDEQGQEKYILELRE